MPANQENKPVAPIARALRLGGGIGLLTGGFIVGITIGALVLGMALDGALGTKPIFTVALLIISMPVALITAMWYTLKLAQRFQQEPGSNNQEATDE